MLTEEGFVYALINPSLPGLVKVGKTSRDVQSRALELSSATGVPTPFIVAFEQFFSDCTQAEDFVHQYLADRGFRVASNREFFDAPLNEVVRAISLAPSSIDAGLAAENLGDADQSGDLSSRIDGLFIQMKDLISDLKKSDEANGPGSSNSLELLDTYHAVYLECAELMAQEASLKEQRQHFEPWSTAFEQGLRFYLGVDMSLIGDEARTAFERAARLGCSKAYLYLGRLQIAEETSTSTGYEHNKTEAARLYKVGADRGCIACQVCLASHFALYHDWPKAQHCWANFWSSVAASGYPEDETKAESIGFTLSYLDLSFAAGFADAQIIPPDCATLLLRELESGEWDVLRLRHKKQVAYWLRRQCDHSTDESHTQQGGWLKQQCGQLTQRFTRR